MAIHPVPATAGEARRSLSLGILISGLLAFTLCQTPAAAGVYRWVDEQGNVHYGDRPPSKKDSTELEVKSTPAPAPEDAARRAKTQRLLDAIATERERKEQATAKAEADQAKQEHNCRRARRQVEFYERANTVFRQDTDGERHYLSETERTEVLAKAKRMVSKWCR